MKVVFDRDGLLIKPETDFEEEWLAKNYDGKDGGVNRAYIRRGVTATDIVGLKVTRVATFAN